MTNTSLILTGWAAFFLYTYYSKRLDEELFTILNVEHKSMIMIP